MDIYETIKINQMEDGPDQLPFYLLCNIMYILHRVVNPADISLLRCF